MLIQEYLQKETNLLPPEHNKIFSDNYIESRYKIRSYEMCKITPEQTIKESAEDMYNAFRSEWNDILWIQSIVFPESYILSEGDVITIYRGRSDKILWSMSLPLLAEVFGTDVIPYTRPPMKRICIPHPNSVLCIPTRMCMSNSYVDGADGRYIQLKCATSGNAHIVLNGGVPYSNEINYKTQDQLVRGPGDLGFPLYFHMIGKSGSKTVEMSLNKTYCANWSGRMVGFYVDASNAPSYRGTSLYLGKKMLGYYTPNMASFTKGPRKMLYYSLQGGIRNPESIFCKENYYIYLSTGYLVMEDISMCNHSHDTTTDDTVCVYSVSRGSL